MKRVLLSLAAVLALAAPAAAQDAEWRTPDPADLWIIDTNKGRIIVELAPGMAPAHAERVKMLSAFEFYDSRTFFRVIDDFMAQTGDPLNDGTGSSAQPDLAPEFVFRRGMDMPFTKGASTPPDNHIAVTTEQGFVGVMPVRSMPSMQMMVTADGKTDSWGMFCPGVAGMARGEPLDSANSQFFLMRGTKRQLDRQYTPFGRVIWGLDVVRAIKTGEPVVEPQDRMTTVRVASALPEAERPRLEVMNTGSAAFKARLEAEKAKRGAAFDVCDVEIPVRLAE